MLIDELLPEFDVRERHRMEVSASPERVFAEVRKLDITDARLSKMLLRLRGISTDKGASGRIDIDNFLKMGFVRLAERENEEILLGLVGRFWSPSGGILRIKAGEFRAFDRPGYAKAAWNFSLYPDTGNRVLLRTETRVYCTDEISRSRFRLYWIFVRPFSGLIRREMLKELKRSAERTEPEL